MIIITHKLNEVAYVADKITVIRDGATIETLDKSKDTFTEDRIIQGMVGRELTNRFPSRESNIGEVALEVKNWTVYHQVYSDRKVVNNVSLHVKKGEVLGISGLMGAGRTELAMSIFGGSYGKNISGQLFIDGKEVKLSSVKEAIRHKIAYVTEDRKGNGLILTNPIRVNTTLANLKGVSSHGVIDRDKEVAVAEEYREKLKTKCPSVEQNVGNLSGGNQQKVLLAKWMYAEPDILILDEPTRGIDVGAKYEIPNIMLWILAIILIYWYITSKTTIGRHLYAIGGNEKAAALSGINTNRVYFFAYANMGFLAAVAAMMTIARLNSANPTAGDGYEMDAIGSCFIGGASAYGGSGTIPGVIIGATLMGVINLGMSIMGVDANWQKVVKGAVLLAAVIFDVESKKHSK